MTEYYGYPFGMPSDPSYVAPTAEPTPAARQYKQRVGPQMEAAVNYVARHPGCSKHEVSIAIGPHGSNRHGYAAVQRAIGAGLIDAQPRDPNNHTTYGAYALQLTPAGREFIGLPPATLNDFGCVSRELKRGNFVTITPNGIVQFEVLAAENGMVQVAPCDPRDTRESFWTSTAYVRVLEGAKEYCPTHGWYVGKLCAQH